MAFIFNAIASALPVIAQVAQVVAPIIKAITPTKASTVTYQQTPFLGSNVGATNPSVNPIAESARQQGVLLTTAGSIQDIPIVYGYRKVGGKITFAETGSVNNQYLWVAYVLSEGTVEGLREILIEDTYLPSNTAEKLNNGQTVDIESGKYAGRVRLQFSHGVYYANPGDSPWGSKSICGDAPSWKTSMVYNGLAVLFARYEWKEVLTQEEADQNPFSGSIPSISVGLLGRRVAAISNARNLSYDNRTERFSMNPAEVIADYLCNPRYGKGLTTADIDWDSFATASSKYATRVEYVSGIRGPILTTNAVIDSGQPIKNNVNLLLQGCRSYLPWVQGKYKLRVEDAGNPTDITSGSAVIQKTFTDDSIVGPITYSSVERTGKYNSVKVGYVDPDKKWSNESVVYPELATDRQTYIDQDGGRINELDVFMPTLTNYAMAKDMAKLLFNKSRYQESLTLTASSEAIELEVGDNIRISSRIVDFDTVPWRIVSIQINNDMTVDIGAVRNPDTIYPHTRYGEEDIVRPVYVPRGATIYYPAVQDELPIGLVPPTNAVTPVIHVPPRVDWLSPPDADEGVPTDISVFGINFKSGVTARFIDADGTEIVPGAITRVSSGELTLRTTVGMTAAKSPYDIRVTNSSAYGSLSSTLRDCLGIDEVPVEPDPPLVDPPVLEPPVDDDTPEPTDPPEDGGETPTNPPTDPIDELPLNDVVDVYEINTTVTGSLAVSTFSFYQPAHPQYRSTTIAIKRSIASEPTWNFFNVEFAPGPGLDISFDLNNLIANQTYEYYTRVRYASGEYSSRVNRSVFVAQDGSVDPEEMLTYAEGAWPVNDTPNTKIRNNAVTGLTGTPLTTGGVPRDPKELQISLAQDIDDEGANWDITGVKIYYKSVTQTQYRETSYTFGDDYVPGDVVTFTFPGSLGSPAYPSVPTTDQQNYDMIFRFVYKDGEESSKVTLVDRVNTEYNTGLYEFDPFYFRLPKIREIKDVDFELVDPSAPSAASSMEINILGIGATTNRGTDEASFYITPPDSSVLTDWAGVRFRTRPVILGTDPEYSEYKETNVGINSTSGNSYYQVPTQFEATQEWVVTPMYFDANGDRQDSTQSWYGAGYVANRSRGADVPTKLLGNNKPNWYDNFNWRSMTTAQALNTIDAAFPAPPDPIVDLIKFETIRRYHPDNSSYQHTYHVIEFDHRAISNYSSLNIYRRQRNTTVLNSYYTKQNGNYDGKGRWEKINSTTTNGSGSVTLNLRVAETYKIFNKKYTSGGTQSFYYGWIDSTKLHVVDKAQDSGINDDILIVAVTSSGEASKGLLLPSVLTSGQTPTGNNLFGQRPTQVSVSSYNNHATQWYRNINQAVTISGANIKNDIYGRNAYSDPSDITLI